MKMKTINDLPIEDVKKALECPGIVGRTPIDLAEDIIIAVRQIEDKAGCCDQIDTLMAIVQTLMFLGR